MAAVTLDPLDLAALLCSRVCHDVISPVGAIVNGLEVLEEDDLDMRDFALDLIRKSADQASARLQFARLAFGAAGSAGASIDLGDAEAVARGMFADDKIALTWSRPRALFPKNKVKLLLNLVTDRDRRRAARGRPRRGRDGRRGDLRLHPQGQGPARPHPGPRRGPARRQPGERDRRRARGARLLRRPRRPRRRHERRHAPRRRRGDDVGDVRSGALRLRRRRPEPSLFSGTAARRSCAACASGASRAGRAGCRAPRARSSGARRRRARRRRWRRRAA